MADYKGVIKFIGENADWALVREYSMIEDNVVTSTGIGTGDASNRYFSATLTPVVEEGEIVIKVDGVTMDAADASGVISGLDISTSTGEESTINYDTGVIEIYFTYAATPGGSEAVTVSYQYSEAPTDFDRHKFIKGDFTGKSVDDSVYYDYDDDTALQDGHYITETFES